MFQGNIFENDSQGNISSNTLSSIYDSIVLSKAIQSKENFVIPSSHQPVTPDYVKGHDHSNPQNINHLVDHLTHYHSQADISILKLNINPKYKAMMRKRKTKERRDVFRLEFLKESKMEPLDKHLALMRLHYDALPT
eukprot:NODE_77_length_23806_cov_0.393892.p14 type:complete len:137 gc:universal NODE_77_length_23806_cov_0.393892:4903-5313(+)